MEGGEQRLRGQLSLPLKDAAKEAKDTKLHRAGMEACKIACYRRKVENVLLLAKTCPKNSCENINCDGAVNTRN